MITSLWGPEPTTDAGEAADFPIEHIAAVEEAAALVIAPATANQIARFAHGMADDFITTACLAATCPVVLAPAMNVNMWNHAATQENVKRLMERGTHFVLPDSGYLACGMVGGGRLAEVETIASEVVRVTTQAHDLTGQVVLVTAGGTREPIDAVRFLGNRSSGKMGYALAEASAARGARVLLVSAASLPEPHGVELHRVNTAAEMHEKVMELLPECTVVFKAAAVADFRPRELVLRKLKRSGGLTLELESTEDIVQEVVRRRNPGTLVVAFAAEVADLLQNGREKLERKGVDAIFVNDVSQGGIGFDSDSNAGYLLSKLGAIELSQMPKRVLADRLITETLKLR